MFLNGTWAISGFADSPEGESFVDKLAVIPFPYTDIPNTMANGVDYGWSVDSKATGARADAAIAFLKEVCSVESAQDALYTSQFLTGVDPGDFDRSRIGLLADVLDILPNMPAESVDLNVWPAVPDPATLTLTLEVMLEYLDGNITLDETISQLDEVTYKNR
jgi:ABC-type glycerol-3-phosphate transport system substrate-binding protein